MYIIKRNGSQVTFDRTKIINAINSANKEVTEKDRLTNDEIEEITKDIEKISEKSKFILNVEDIQNLVEDHIWDLKKFNLGRTYSQYRFLHNINRDRNDIDDAILNLVDYNNEEIKQENSNKNPQISSTQRDYIAGEVSKDISKRRLIPSDIWKAHEEGIIHFHDTDYFLSHITNCCLVNLEDMLQNGTVISNTSIDTPHSFSTACNIATQIIAQIASSQYGGQSISLGHLAPFVDVSRQKIKRDMLKDLGVESEDELNDRETSFFKRTVERQVKDEITKGVQTIQYQILTLMTVNGQTPFITIFMYLNEVPEGQTRNDLLLLIEEVTKQRKKGVKNEKGVWITPTFPKLIYVLDEDNIIPGSKYYHLSELAADCISTRMVPDLISAKKEKEYKDGYVYPCMGCRSFLTSEPGIVDENGNRKFYGRFNQGVITINLVDVALSSEGDEEKFWKIYEERLELCHRALRLRHERLLGTTSDIAPILWQHGGYARLQKGEKIDKLLFNGYSTISLGYAGLYECVYAMKKKSHTDPDAMPFAMAIMQKLNDKTKEWREAENIAYSVYGTPIESTTYKFAKCLQKRFGIIENVTDHNYITNSYHVNVRENIDAATKLKFEAPFQVLSPGGAISYIETPNLEDNTEAILDMMRCMYDNTLYAEFNTKSDYCQVCGYTGEIKIIDEEDTGKLIWECPQCKNRDQHKMNVTRRTCGYLGANFWNQGRTAEIRDRVIHLDNAEANI